MGEPRVGDFGLVDTRSRFGWLIKLGTRSPVDHAVVYVGGGLIVEAQARGAVISRAARYPRAVWSSVPLTDAQREGIRVAALGLRGVPYGFVDIVALAWAVLGFPVPAWVWRRINRQDRLICSQLVAVAYAAAGVELIPGLPPCRVTPGLLLDVAVLGLPEPS